MVSDAKPETEDDRAGSVFDGRNGVITVEVDDGRDLEWGDEFTISYRGDDPDSARGLTGVSIPPGKQVTPTRWTFEFSLSRADRYAVTATADDSEFNQGRGGVGDPTDGDATVFEIDNELAGDVGARTVPPHDPPGNLPQSISEPFFIEFYWDGTDDSGEVGGEDGVVAGTKLMNTPATAARR